MTRSFRLFWVLNESYNVHSTGPSIQIAAASSGRIKMYSFLCLCSHHQGILSSKSKVLSVAGHHEIAIFVLEKIWLLVSCEPPRISPAHQEWILSISDRFASPDVCFTWIFLMVCSIAESYINCVIQLNRLPTVQIITFQVKSSHSGDLSFLYSSHKYTVLIWFLLHSQTGNSLLNIGRWS